MINCTIGSFLLHFFLLIYHPYPPSFHEMIFILVQMLAASIKTEAISIVLHPQECALIVGCTCMHVHAYITLFKHFLSVNGVPINVSL